MKLLVVGFTAQNAAVLATLISRNYPECNVVIIERVIYESIRLGLPKIEDNHADASAMMIDLNGVGMIRYLPKYKEELERFIRNRAALLVVRSDYEAWSSANILPKHLELFVKQPYDKQTIENALSQLIAIAGDIRPEKTTEPSTNDAPAPTTTAVKSTSVGLQAVLEKYFHASHHPLFENLLIENLEVPVKVTAGHQVFYLNQNQNLALVSHKEQLLEYCAVVRRFESIKQALYIDQISDRQFDELSNSGHYQKYTLDTLLWQIYDTILPERIQASSEHLGFKLKYMPNVAEFGVSEEAKSILWSCLTTERTLIALLHMHDSQMNLMQLNRLLLIALMAGVADADALGHHRHQDQAQVNKSQNEGVQKAKTSGFLGRLMKALIGK